MWTGKYLVMFHNCTLPPSSVSSSLLRTLRHWRSWQYALPRHLQFSTSQPSTASQKTSIFINTTVWTSNLTSNQLFMLCQWQNFCCINLFTYRTAKVNLYKSTAQHHNESNSMCSAPFTYWDKTVFIICLITIFFLLIIIHESLHYTHWLIL